MALDEKEQKRKNDFLEANKDKSATDYEWAKSIWNTYADELEAKTDARLCCGFCPVETDKLVKVKAYLEKTLTQLNDELSKRV